MDTVENIKAKIRLNVIIIGAGIGGLAAATVSINLRISGVSRSDNVNQSYFNKFKIGL